MFIVVELTKYVKKLNLRDPKYFQRFLHQLQSCIPNQEVKFEKARDHKFLSTTNKLAT